RVAHPPDAWAEGREAGRRAPGSGQRPARPPPGVRAPRAPRARAADDRAHAGAAAGQAAPRARPRAALQPGPGPLPGAPDRGAAQEAARVARTRAPRPAALGEGRRAPHDARLPPDRRRAARPEVSAAATAPARAVRA